jgi:hypothetical protein
LCFFDGFALCAFVFWMKTGVINHLSSRTKSLEDNDEPNWLLYKLQKEAASSHNRLAVGYNQI